MTGPGHERLSLYFELSYASWLTLPRVLMERMPDEWQDRMAALLEEYEETFPCQPDIGARVQVTDSRGHLIKTPEWLINYRHPDFKRINELRPPEQLERNQTGTAGQGDTAEECGAQAKQ